MLKLTLPAGRIVQGAPTFKSDKDPQGRPKDKSAWFLAIAVEKTNQEVNGIINQIMQFAWTSYQSVPQVLEGIKLGFNGPFRWKIEDGDKNPQKEGYAGCWIFKLSTSLGVIPCCNAQNQLIDPSLVKCGYYVDAAINVDINKNTDNTAGVYLNPEMVRLLGYGKEIQPGPTPDQLFANRPATMPHGASAQPVSPGGFPGGGNPGGGGFPGGGNPGGGGFPGGGFTNPASGQVVQATGVQVPAHSPAGTAFPSNAYPGATPYPAFLGGTK